MSGRYPARVPPTPAPPPLHAGTLPTTGELVVELGRLSRQLDAANDYLRIAAKDYAVAEDAYRMAKAKHQLEARGALLSMITQALATAEAGIKQMRTH